MDKVWSQARRYGTSLHVDGARLFNAAVSWCKRGGHILLTLEDNRANEPEAKLMLVATTLAMELLMASFRIRAR